MAPSELFKFGDLFFEPGDSFIHPVGAAAEAHGFHARNFFFVSRSKAFLSEGDPVTVFLRENVIAGFEGVDFEADFMHEVTEVAAGEACLGAEFAFTAIVGI